MIRLKVDVRAGRLELDKKQVRAALRAAGNEVAMVARRLIRRSAGAGRFYYVGGSSGGRGRYQASAPGQPPTSVSGALAKSIKVRPFKSGEGVAIRDAQFYAKFLEAGAHGGGGSRKDGNLLLAGERNARGRVLRGKNRLKKSAISKTRVLAPRPFLSIALEERGASIEQRLGVAINSGLKFVRRGVK